MQCRGASIFGHNASVKLCATAKYDINHFICTYKTINKCVILTNFNDVHIIYLFNTTLIVKVSLVI